MAVLNHFEEITVVTLEANETENSKTAILVKSVKEQWTEGHTGPWSPELWMAFREAMQRGERVPNPRYPVVINNQVEKGPITNPEVLQRLLELPSVPIRSTTTTTTTDSDSSLDSDQVDIIDIDWFQTDILEERAETEEIFIWFYGVRAKKTIPRTAYVVKSIKE